jgi:hypothetical protein
MAPVVGPLQTRRSLDARCAVVILLIEQAVPPTSLWT